MLRLMSSAVFIRPGYCGVTWYIPRTLQRTRKPLCFQHTWYRFYDELEKVLAALQKKDWKAFARLYNGPAYAQNRYDEKLSTAYSSFNK